MIDQYNESRILELDDRSDEVKEILGKAPIWMVRWGITIIFVSLILVIVGTSIISYHQIVSGRVSITTSEPPAYLEARSTGRISGVFVSPNQIVKVGEVLAEIENTARLQDVSILRKRLEFFSLHNDIVLDSITMFFPYTLQLGPIQSHYNTFIQHLKKFILHANLQPNKTEINLINLQLEEQRKLLESQLNQLNLFKEELIISEKIYLRNKNLYEQKVISDMDFEILTRGVLSDRQKIQILNASVYNTEISLVTLETAKAKAVIRDIESKQAYKQLVDESLQQLRNAIDEWEYLFLVKSPINGTVTFFDIWNANQNIEAGKVLFTVIPYGAELLIGKVTLPVKNSGKVKVGQSVIIKLDNFPYHEWGSINGEVVSISGVPKQGEEVYTIFIQVNGLNTSFNRKLDFKQEMKGNAEIITEKLSLLERIFYELRKVFERKA